MWINACLVLQLYILEMTEQIRAACAVNQRLLVRNSFSTNPTTTTLTLSRDGVSGGGAPELMEVWERS